MAALINKQMIFDIENNLMAFYPLSNHTYVTGGENSSSLVVSSSVNSEDTI